MLDDAKGRITFIRDSPNYRVTCAQCEYALICVKNGAQMVNLPILVFPDNHQLHSMMLGCEHGSQQKTFGPSATSCSLFLKVWSDTCIPIA